MKREFISDGISSVILRHLGVILFELLQGNWGYK